ncbi:hypothetical protein AB0C76_26175 [Kitasatospora sp. NPDC048722]|uniref:hypothetical protein n=1 Tax=Kitasatospora sp. NPDC048722 TaxID=3155639 RepID=UPI0033CBBF5D
MATSLGEGYVCLARLDEYYRFITTKNQALRMELFESSVRELMARTAAALDSAFRSAVRQNEACGVDRTAH